MACSHCGGNGLNCCQSPDCSGQTSQNTAHCCEQCGRNTRSCKCSRGNPCGTTCNTAACETLPSQIENFTKQFFGSVIKTEVNGVVTWALPCDLDIGLENNPRLDGEGLACYFIRLFEAGIIGLTGPQGDDGTAGADGFSAFTVTLAGFTQPTSGNPNVVVRTAFNPALVPGMTVFIAGSGWYNVSATADDGTLFLSLVQGLSGASGTITAGKIVVPTGPQGVSIQGNQGEQGVPGPPGDEGESFTQSNDMFFTDVGVDYPLPVTFTAVDFNNAVPQLLLPTAGTYLITAEVALVGNVGVLTIDQTDLLLRDTTITADLSGSQKTLNGMQDTDRRHVSINVIYDSDSANHTIALYGKCTTASAVSVVALQTTITFVRLA